ncbi:MAG: DUF4124 domain-containing protein [Bdellovibrionota bacterium]
MERRISLRQILVLALLAGGILFSPASGAAKVYRYVDGEGHEHFTNDPATVPDEYKKQLEVPPSPPPVQGGQGQSSEPKGTFRIESRSKTPDAALQEAAPASGAEETPAPVATPPGEGRAAVKLLGDAAQRWVIDPVTGLILLPESVKEAEQRARPYARMLLLFLLAIVFGILAAAGWKRFRQIDTEDLAANPILRMPGLLFGSSVILGAVFSIYAWHGAKLNWKKEMSDLWMATGGALAASENGAMRLALSTGTYEINEPGELLKTHRKIEERYHEAIQQADADIGYVEEICIQKQAPENLGDVRDRLLNMGRGFKQAEKIEEDIETLRRAGEKRGFSLGPDPRETQQLKIAQLQKRLTEAQAACGRLAVEGRKQQKEALDAATGG